METHILRPFKSKIQFLILTTKSEPPLKLAIYTLARHVFTNLSIFFLFIIYHQVSLYAYEDGWKWFETKKKLSVYFNSRFYQISEWKEALENLKEIRLCEKFTLKACIVKLPVINVENVNEFWANEKSVSQPNTNRAVSKLGRCRDPQNGIQPNKTNIRLKSKQKKDNFSKHFYAMPSSWFANTKYCFGTTQMK